MKHDDGPLTAGRLRLFMGVKYLVYVLLSLNVYLFLDEELAALQHTFVDGFAVGQIIQVFSATIDTAAWVLLLLLFELETSTLEDALIRGPLKCLLHGLRMLCYAAVFYAFTGYYAELLTLYQVQPLPGFDACASLDNGLSLLLAIDEYGALTAGNCAALTPPVYQLGSFDIVADGRVLQQARWLAWTDVVNAGTWLLVVIVLEVEVRLQLRGNLSDRFMGVALLCKYALYGTLFACAAYWGVAGDFLDFWDAALWLFAFMFIELNVFEWHAETSQEAPQAA